MRDDSYVLLQLLLDVVEVLLDRTDFLFHPFFFVDDTAQLIGIFWSIREHTCGSFLL